MSNTTIRTLIITVVAVLLVAALTITAVIVIPKQMCIRDSPYRSVKEMAVAFLIYGALAEIFARETGFNRGVGGSMHAYFLPFGIYPNNAIVGGSADIATGAALFKRCLLYTSRCV